MSSLKDDFDSYMKTFKYYSEYDENGTIKFKYFDDILREDQKCKIKYFREIRDLMVSYYEKREDYVELLTVLEIITAICYNLYNTPWREEFKTLRVKINYFLFLIRFLFILF